MNLSSTLRLFRKEVSVECLAKKFLSELATNIIQRNFSVAYKRVPGILTCQLVVTYQRSCPKEVKLIEQALKYVRPELNRKQRRHFARRHRYCLNG